MWSKVHTTWSMSVCKGRASITLEQILNKLPIQTLLSLIMLSEQHKQLLYTYEQITTTNPSTNSEKPILRVNFHYREIFLTACLGFDHDMAEWKVTHGESKFSKNSESYFSTATLGHTWEWSWRWCHRCSRCTWRGTTTDSRWSGAMRWTTSTIQNTSTIWWWLSLQWGSSIYNTKR